jgi:hypothetical protein
MRSESALDGFRLASGTPRAPTVDIRRERQGQGYTF